MKNQGRIILVTAFLSALLWSCAKNDGIVNSLSLKSAINQSALNLNTAMDAISSSKAYSILTVTDGTQKSASTTDSNYRVYITLDTVKGVYDYKPVPKTDRWGLSLIRYFNKASDNSKMIVRMPLKKVVNPRYLREYVPSDSLLTNNFSIAVSGYHNNYNSYHDFDYILASEISVDNVLAGNLNINYFVSPTLGIKYASQYAFSSSYTADYKYESGDTTVSSFTITGDNKVLYEEKLLTVKIDTGRFGREHQYILTIGDVQIIRKSGTKAVEVYVNGLLQPDAVVAIVDKVADPEASVCKKRDIQITFEDGTTSTVSALIGNSIENIKTLFDSLHSVYFAAYVVDWIAYDIYYQRN
ncbi:MAG: hypothetical protein NT144_10010 [Bacteroidia bacterium]|nr:hypothetical protein [Bacteroidia bacterium]